MKKEWLRYSCQLALPGFTEATQLLLQQSNVLIVGAGGLGCPAAQYLTAAGVGTIGIADFDTISISNLHRQILYTPEEVGQQKALLACKKLGVQNPSVRLVPHPFKITSENVRDLIQQYDIVVDGTDNFETRYLLNDACVLAGKPLVYGAIYQFEGQVAVWNVTNRDGTKTPNYRDLFPQVNATEIPNCAEGGVIPTLAGIIGCLQANEVLKWITQKGDLLAGKLLLFDALTAQSRIIKTAPVTKTDIKELIPTETVPVIAVTDLKRNFDKNVYELIDIRTDEERNTFNIGGKHIPLHKIEQDTSYLNSNKLVILYCASGKRSAEVVKRIKKQFPDLPVFSLEGGLKAWLE